MNEITIIEYNNGNKFLVYENIKINNEKQLIKNSVSLIISDKELENVKDMHINEVIKLIDDILKGNSVF